MGSSITHYWSHTFNLYVGICSEYVCCESSISVIGKVSQFHLKADRYSKHTIAVIIKKLIVEATKQLRFP